MTLFFNFALFTIYRNTIDFPKLISHIHSLILIFYLHSHMITMEKIRGIFQQLSHITHIHIFLFESSLFTINILMFLYFRNSSDMFVIVFVFQNLCWPVRPAHMNFCKLPKSWIASDYLFCFYLLDNPV